MSSRTLLPLALAAGFLTASPAADWPTLRGPAGDGVCKEKLGKLLDDPEQLWSAQGPKGNGGVVIAEGRGLVCGTGSINLLCFDLKTGDPLWSKGDLGEWYGNFTPTVSGGRVFVMNYMDKAPKARCFDAKTGDELWVRELPAPTKKRSWGHSGSPLVVGDAVILNVGGGVALDAETGDVIWRFEGFAGMAVPVPFEQGGKKAVAIFLGDQLIARDLATGKEIWTIPWETKSGVNAHRPVIFDGKVFINSDYGLGRAMYDVSSGKPKELWNFPKGSGHAFAASILHDGLIYGFFEHRLACLDPADGSLRWKGHGNGSLLQFGDQFLQLTEKGEMHVGAVSKDGFEPVLSAQVHGGTVRNNPTYFDGKLISKNDKGGMVCVKIAE